MSFQKPVNTILAYESSISRERLVELEVYTDEEPDEEGNVWVRTEGRNSTRLMISKDLRVWWITERKEGWKRDRTRRVERICGYQARLLPLPEVGALSHLIKSYWMGHSQGEANG